MSDRYAEFLKSKARIDHASGFIVTRGSLNAKLFDFQRDIVRWAIARGRAALFESTGLGKSFQQAEWARCVEERESSPVLILAPLAVAYQTIAEAAKFGISVKPAAQQSDVGQRGVYITNYQKLNHFDPQSFCGVVLDESSIIKHHDAKTRDILIESFGASPYRLACTATPAPNDYVELGNHAEFLGVMTMEEMLATFFVHDGGETQKWRLKGHAEDAFWEWVASWAVCINHPRDIGYDDQGYDLPALCYHEHIVSCDLPPEDGFLLRIGGNSLEETRTARKASVRARCETAATLANHSDGQWLIWCDLNDESETCSEMINGAIEVTGSDSDDHKEDAMLAFARGEIRVLVSKPSICGMGMNWQGCANMAFVGVSHSFERLYQAVRRCWRFGQLREVNAHLIISEHEHGVLQNIKRKERDFENMTAQMVRHMAHITRDTITAQSTRQTTAYIGRTTMSFPNWI